MTRLEHRAEYLPAMANGVVKFWRGDKGWGAISSGDLPAGKDAWAHFSVVDVTGYRELMPGQAVEFTFEAAQQDSFEFRATWVRPID